MSELERCELAKERGYTYDPITGEIRGIYGKLITRKSSDGYIYFRVYKDGKPLNTLGHRLAWFLYYGKLPNNHIDHIDCNRVNNKIENLRDVTNQQNMFNKPWVKGYTWKKQNSKFQAQISHNGKKIHLGYFTNETDARNAYLEAKAKLHVIN